MKNKRNRWWIYLALFLVAISVLLMIGKRLSVPLSGDEPHYLIMAESIIHDHNLDVKNEYQLELYNDFYHQTLDAHINTSQFNDNSSRWYSIHYPGLPLLIVSFFRIGGTIGAMALMVFFSATLLFLTYLWAVKIIKDKRLALLAPIILFFSTFFLGLVGRLYPDIIIADLLLTAMLLMEKSNKKRLDFFFLGMLSGFSFWLHIKSVLFLCTILGIVFFQIVFSKKTSKEKYINTAYILLPFLALVVPFELKIHQWYHLWLPNQIYSGNGQPFSLSNTKSLLAILFDSVKGTVVNNPIAILIFSAIPFWFFNNRKQFIKVCLVIFPSIIIFSSFPDWGGGWSPTGRYVMETLPILIPSIIFLFASAKNILWKISLYIFLLAHCLLGVLWIIFKPTWTSNQNILYTKISDHLFGINLTDLFPRFLINGATLNPLDRNKLVVQISIASALFLLGLILSYIKYLKKK